MIIIFKQDKPLPNAYRQPLYNVLEFRANIDAAFFTSLQYTKLSQLKLEGIFFKK
jgi:hypothetical protein